MFRDHSYGFRPGRGAADAMRAAQGFAREGKEWVVDMDIAKFLDTASYCPLVHEGCSNSAGC
jgi:RNA-directed DNA polymerase